MDSQIEKLGLGLLRIGETNILVRLKLWFDVNRWSDYFECSKLVG